MIFNVKLITTVIGYPRVIRMTVNDCHFGNNVALCSVSDRDAETEKRKKIHYLSDMIEKLWARED